MQFHTDTFGSPFLFGAECPKLRQLRRSQKSGECCILAELRSTVTNHILWPDAWRTPVVVPNSDERTDSK